MSCNINKPVKLADFNVFKVDKYWWKKLCNHKANKSAEVHMFS